MTSHLLSYIPSLPSNLRSVDARTASLATIGTLTALTSAYIVRDYNQWISFGSGGTPPTPSGYWRMTKLRWRAYWSGDDMRDPAPLFNVDGPQFLSSELLQRRGERPQILARTMPQRQKPEVLTPSVKDRLHGIPAKYCNENPDILTLDLSKTEGKSTDAIYAKPDLPGRHPSAQDKILGNEIAHVHPAENSLHVWLSGPDAKTVVEKGWGERFPLSAMGLCHPSLVMVYAPRSAEDVDVIEEIVKAGVGYLTGVKI
ncbi:hypothetical protein LTR37_019599 [Vermiconidia calcicola]|uniref:Uncharacterized protein n=1 Tax=Vermiconidia calcicola TaxID=1690605 RepID=A0ACC3MDT1_9PEZI|nr:hypothetical protein LTR37_019599 [Vermiconidia calcicola]